jgi:hypothetical protein
MWQALETYVVDSRNRMTVDIDDPSHVFIKYGYSCGGSLVASSTLTSSAPMLMVHSGVCACFRTRTTLAKPRGKPAGRPRT